MSLESSQFVPIVASEDRSSESKQSPRTSAKKKSKKSKKRPDKNKLTLTHLDHIQSKINHLEAEVARMNEIESNKDQTKVTDDDRKLLDKRHDTSLALDQLKNLHTELSTPEMLRKATPEVLPERKRKDEEKAKAAAIRVEQHTMTLLHFFYVVRLAQKGFFSVLGDACPDVELNALVYLCDKIVGSSLFAAKHHSKEIRNEKHADVFRMLEKLHDGVDESIDGFKTTYKQVKDLVISLACNSMPHQLASSSAPTSPPVLLVVPFSGMIDVPTPLFNPTMPVMQPTSLNGVNSDKSNETLETASQTSVPKEEKEEEEDSNIASTAAETEESKVATKEETGTTTPSSRKEETPTTEDLVIETGIEASKATEVDTKSTENEDGEMSPTTQAASVAQVASESWRQIPGSNRRHERSNGSNESGDRGSFHKRSGRGRRRGGGSRGWVSR